MNHKERLAEIASRYKKNDQGAVERPAFNVSAVDTKNKAVTFESTVSYEYSQEIEDVHYLINRVRTLTEALEEINTKCRRVKDIKEVVVKALEGE